MSGKMLRRFSTKIGLTKEKPAETNGNTDVATNGISNGISNGTTNGTTNGNSGSTQIANGISLEDGAADNKVDDRPAPQKRQTFFSQKSQTKQQIKKDEETFDHSASRVDIEKAFEQFGQVIHASLRPIPTQTGDGEYLDHPEPSGGILADIKARPRIIFTILFELS